MQPKIISSGRIEIQAKKIKINRLFLIGNGFDISLGLQTKYSDFLLWLLKIEVQKALNSNITDPVNINYEEVFNPNAGHYDKRIRGYSKNKLFETIIHNSNFEISNDTLCGINKLFELFEFCKRYWITFKTSDNINLMSKILSSSKENWVDIENIYFSLLKQVIIQKENHYKESIVSINQELTESIIYLKKYLSTLDVTIKKPIAQPHFKIFSEDLNVEDFLEFDEEQKIEVGVNYFLNFNYADTVTEVLKYYEYASLQNFIHGNLIDEEIIFGFGDEMDKFYKEIEELNDNEFFKHIKSFHYFKTSNQRQLQTFLNSDLYQVCVYGHSCGLSDRVMLNEIFEHENCKSIKIYYYNDEDFTTKTMEISRHFNSNQLMRKKIVNKSKHCFIPQIK